PPPALYSLSLHDALPIFLRVSRDDWPPVGPIRPDHISLHDQERQRLARPRVAGWPHGEYRMPMVLHHESRFHRRREERLDFIVKIGRATRLNSSHVKISY